MNYSDREDLSTGKVIDGTGISLADVARHGASVESVAVLYDELISVIERAGEVLDNGKQDQLIRAMDSLYIKRSQLLKLPIPAEVNTLGNRLAVTMSESVLSIVPDQIIRLHGHVGWSTLIAGWLHG